MIVVRINSVKIIDTEILKRFQWNAVSTPDADRCAGNSSDSSNLKSFDTG